MRTPTWLLAVSLFAGITEPAGAQHRGHANSNTGAHTGTSPNTTATHEFKAAHARMMRNMAMPFTGDPDVDFRKHMIPHHQGAVDMAQVALRHAKDPWTRQVADAISVAQPREIYEFRAWLAGRGMMHRRPRVNMSAVREFKAAHARMMRNMAMPFTGEPDVDFRMHMIPHHQGAIEMARVALRHAKDPWTRQNAEAIIIAQQQESYEFQNWLARRGAMVPRGGKPRYIVRANSYPQNVKADEEEPGSLGELVGKTWAPGSGVPPQPQIFRR